MLNISQIGGKNVILYAGGPTYRQLVDDTMNIGERK